MSRLWNRSSSQWLIRVSINCCSTFFLFVSVALVSHVVIGKFCWESNLKADNSISVEPGQLSRYSNRLRARLQRNTFPRLHSVQTGSETHPASYPLGSGLGVLSPDVHQPGHEADHPTPSGAEVKNGEPIPSPPIRLHGVVLNFLIS
jgi:hypothetical protein